MRKYRFTVWGGSPGPGFITALAKQERTARRLSEELLKKQNEQVSYSEYTLGDLEEVEAIKVPCIIEYDFGER